MQYFSCAGTFDIIAYTRAINQIMMSSHSNNLICFLGEGQNAYSAPSIIILGGSCPRCSPLLASMVIFCVRVDYIDSYRFWMIKHPWNGRGQGYVTRVFRSTLRRSRPNKAGLKYPPVSPCVRAYVRPADRPQMFLQLESNLACRYRWMSDARRYAVWPDPRSRSRALQSCKSGQF